MRVCMVIEQDFSKLIYDNRVLKELETIKGAGHKLILVGYASRDEAGDTCSKLQEAVGQDVALHYLYVEDIYGLQHYNKYKKDISASTLYKKVFRELGIRLYKRKFDRSLYNLLVKIGADVYHAHDFPVLAPVVKAARRAGAKVVYDSHELWMETKRYRYNLARILNFFDRQKEAKHISQVDRVITVCDSIADELSARYHINRPEVIRNLPPLGNVINNGEESTYLRDKYSLKRDKTILIYVGSLSKGRALEKMVYSLGYLEDVVLFMVGGGSLLERLKNISIQEGFLGKKIYFIGFQPYHSLFKITSSADIGLVPVENICLNHYYSLPNKLFEYIISGLPVAASNFPEIKNVIDRYQVGVTFNPADPREIAGSLQDLIGSRQELKQMQANTFEARQELNWEKEEQKLLKLYSSLE